MRWSWWGNKDLIGLNGTTLCLNAYHLYLKVFDFHSFSWFLMQTLLPNLKWYDPVYSNNPANKQQTRVILNVAMGWVSMPPHLCKCCNCYQTSVKEDLEKNSAYLALVPFAVNCLALLMCWRWSESFCGTCGSAPGSVWKITAVN